MYRIKLTFIVVLLSSISAFAQYQMDISIGYNIPASNNFSENFNNGFGATSEFSYFFNNSNFSASLLIGINSFRANEQYEQDLEDSNPTIFDYEYQIHYHTFPLLLAGNYTFFNAKKFNFRLGMGVGMQFMELKKKLIGNYVSDTHIDNFNEFAIYPNLGLSYQLADNIDIILKSGYNATFGEIGISYIDFKIGIKYDI
jgi:hypothetical protein